MNVFTVFVNKIRQFLLISVLLLLFGPFVALKYFMVVVCLAYYFGSGSPMVSISYDMCDLFIYLFD